MATKSLNVIHGISLSDGADGSPFLAALSGLVRSPNGTLAICSWRCRAAGLPTSLNVMDAKKKSHDAVHRLLFSHPQLVEDLLRHFVAEETEGSSWLEDLDFASLCREHESSTEPKRGKSLYRDIVWSIGWRNRPDGERLYVVILIEFQSSVGWFMVLRKLAYMAFFYQDLVKARKLKPGDRLPAVLPVVLYDGERPWRAPLSVEELIGPVPEPLRQFQPQYRYLLLDELHTAVRLGEERNTVAGMMALEQSRTPEEIVASSMAIDAWLREDEDEDLRQTFAVLLHQALPADMVGDTNPLDLTETTMRARKYLENWEETQSRKLAAKLAAEVTAKVGAEKLAEGQRLLLEKLLRLKFGALPADAEERLRQAQPGQLEGWAGRVLTASSLDEIWR